MASMYDEFTMKVNSGQVGRIIGRGGSKIKELQSESGAKISVAREEDHDGKVAVEISGDADQIERARELIDVTLRNDFSRGGYNSRGRGGGGGGGFGYNRSNGGGGSWGRRDDGDRWNDRDRGQRNYDDQGPKETVYVDSSEVGRIIGRGGSRIRDLENDSGCRIKVSRDSHGGGRNSVDLIGRADQIHKAKQLILEAGVELINGDDRGRGW